jgi:hypothetical protein
LCVDAGHGGAGSVRFVVGDALGYALVRSGGVVVHLVLGQDGTQMSLAEYQHPVEELAAQGANEAFAGRVHARCPAKYAGLSLLSAESRCVTDR